MNYRIDVGTDIALIGAWDQSQNRSVLPALPFAQHRAQLASDAQLGRVFLLQLGGDWGGPIDVFVDTELPRSYQSKFKKVKGEFLIVIPTGRLVVGGAEDYRSETAKITSESSVISLPEGDYQLQCHYAKDEEAPAFVMPSASELETVIGGDDYRYYKRISAWTMRVSLGKWNQSSDLCEGSSCRLLEGIQGLQPTIRTSPDRIQIL